MKYITEDAIRKSFEYFIDLDGKLNLFFGLTAILKNGTFLEGNYLAADMVTYSKDVDRIFYLAEPENTEYTEKTWFIHFLDGWNEGIFDLFLKKLTCLL